MMPSCPDDVTILLRQWQEGNADALTKLTPLVYAELKQRARRHLRGERPEHAADTTSLVNEAFLRLVRGADVNWKDRAHFFAVSARIMRRILIDAARARGSAKRGGTVSEVNLDHVANVAFRNSRELVALDEALMELERIDVRKARVVELRFFSGLTAEETAEILKVSPKTVIRDWKLAKSWLHREIQRTI